MLEKLTRSLKKGRVAGWIFTCGLAVLLLAIFTPLEFRHPPLALSIAALVGILSFSVFKQLAAKIRNGWIRGIVANIPNAVLFLLIVLLIATLPFSVMSVWNSLGGYKTVWVKYRKKSNPNIQIALQMKDVGSLGYKRRTVLIVPLSPLFAWVTHADNSTNNKEWKKVDEHYNPFGWKGP